VALVLQATVCAPAIGDRRSAIGERAWSPCTAGTYGGQRLDPVSYQLRDVAMPAALRAV
jgi:hypothetical protein